MSYPNRERGGLPDRPRTSDDRELSPITHGKRIEGNADEMETIRKVQAMLESLIEESTSTKRQLAVYQETMGSLLERSVETRSETLSAIYELKEVLGGLKDIVFDTRAGPVGSKAVKKATDVPKSPVNDFLDAGVFNYPKENDIPGKKAVLSRLPSDYLSNVVVMRWVEFLLNRVVRDRLPLVLDYYKDIGWISEEVKSVIMAVARGENQDFDAPEIEEESEFDLSQIPMGKTDYKMIDDWRMTAEDHLRSLLFIHMMAGDRVDKNRLSTLEQTITDIKRSLSGFYGV